MVSALVFGRDTKLSRINLGSSQCGDACPTVLVLVCSPQVQAGPLPSLTGICVMLD